MSNFSVAPFFPPAELSMAERGIESAKVILTGFVVVFAVLFMLIIIIKAYSTIVGKAQDAAYKKKKKQKINDSEEALFQNTSKPVSPPAPAAQEGIPEEVIAVISAAVASMYDSPKGVRIKSIKKSGAGRSAWASAGVLDNTRPF